jgi:hypothetical protein
MQPVLLALWIMHCMHRFSYGITLLAINIKPLRGYFRYLGLTVLGCFS